MTKNTDILFAKAVEFYEQNRFKEAIEQFKGIINENPKDSKALAGLGLAFAGFGDLHNALKSLELACQISPEDAILQNNLANLYKETSNPDKALTHYLKAIELAPNYPEAHHNLALLYSSQKNIPKALHHYQKALHLAPDYLQAHFNLALLFLKNQKLKEAKIQFNNVISLYPSHLQAQFYLGLLYLADNDLEKANHHFTEVLALDNEEVDALTNLGVIALKQNKNQLAIDYFTKALAIDNNHLDARNNLAATFIHHDRFENALMHYDVLLQEEPNNIEYLYNTAVAQMALGHLPEATLLFEKILQLNPNHVAALNNLAAIFIRLEKRDKALELLGKALEINPKDATAGHMFKALSGLPSEGKETPEYAANLFNNYALYYDSHMQNELHYSLPSLVEHLIQQFNIKAEKTLDLGCGTGLMGPILKPRTQELIGVDISVKMLNEARQKSLYDKLIESEIVAFLEQDTHNYDLIIAADVIPYLGTLNPLFKALTKRLTKKGYFIFNIEINAKESWHLENTSRFSHSNDYIETLSQEYQFDILSDNEIVARKQNGQDVKARLYCLKML